MGPGDDGVRDYRVRLATAHDVPLITALYARLSPRSLHTRFSSNVSLDGLARLASLSDETISVIALGGSDVAGEARYVPWEGTSEFAITVADEHQGRGVGRLLLRHLRDVARERGMTSLRAVIQTDNAAMLRIVKQLGIAVVTPPDGGEVVVDIASDDYMPDWGPDTGRPRVLVEAPNLWQSAEADALRRAGFELRQCLGPRSDGPLCPLLVHGRCRLAEQADVVATLLPADAETSGQILGQHRRRRPDQLIATSLNEWRSAVAAMVASDA